MPDSSYRCWCNRHTVTAESFISTWPRDYWGRCEQSADYAWKKIPQIFPRREMVDYWFNTNMSVTDKVQKPFVKMNFRYIIIYGPILNTSVKSRAVFYQHSSNSNSSRMPLYEWLLKRKTLPQYLNLTKYMKNQENRKRRIELMLTWPALFTVTVFITLLHRR